MRLPAEFQMMELSERDLAGTVGVERAKNVLGYGFVRQSQDALPAIVTLVVERPERTSSRDWLSTAW